MRESFGKKNLVPEKRPLRPSDLTGYGMSKRRFLFTRLLFVFVLVLLIAFDNPLLVDTQVLGQGPGKASNSVPKQPSYLECRRTLVSTKINPPDPFPGYGGFNGWQEVIRLRNGDLLVAFCAGYWHVSFPTPYDIPADLLKSYEEAGFPRSHKAPTGGRILYIRSTDNGLTWTRPETLVDSPWDDQEPSFNQLPDGTIVLNFFVIADWYGYEQVPKGRRMNSLPGSLRSFDNGYKWERKEEIHWVKTPLRYADRSSSPSITLQDGSLLMATCGVDRWGQKSWRGPIYRSQDRGATWQILAVIDHVNIDEPAIAQLPSGRILLVTRIDGKENVDSPVIYSDDGGKTWSQPISTGVQIKAPHLLVLRDGTVVILYGPPGGLRTIFSTDGGMNWIKTVDGNGFSIDPSVYGYPSGCELPDGSVYCVYYDGWNKQVDTGVWAIRFRINPSRDGIQLLPVPGAASYDPSSHGFGDSGKRPTGTLDIDALGREKKR